jgi:hypothetical protein
MGIYFTLAVDWSLTGLFKTKAPAVYVCSERWSPLLMMSAWGAFQQRPRHGHVFCPRHRGHQNLLCHRG